MNYFIRSIPVTLLVLIGAFLKPKLQEAGVFRTIANVNNERCSRIEGLQACEDIFVDQPTGLAYLACSHRKDRANWLPALNVLKLSSPSVHPKAPLSNYRLFSRIPHRYENIQGQSSADYLTILDLNTHDHRKVKLTNLPESLLQGGIHTHGLDLFVHPEKAEPGEPENAGAEAESTHPRKATIFLINHRSSQDSSLPHPGTADSVIEVFDTIIGSDEATYRRTIHHDLVITPNNLVALNENSFYVTNDHLRKKHWTRDLEVCQVDFVAREMKSLRNLSVDSKLRYANQVLFLDSALDSVVHCSFEESVQCIAALHGRYQFPNGIAKGPGNTIYMTNSLNAHLRLLEIQPDNTLIVKEEYKVPRVIDNIYVNSAGSVFIASIPSFLKFENVLKELHKEDSSAVSPSEVWKFSNQTSPESPQKTPFKLERIFADDGNQVSGTTSLAPWNSKLFMTGILSSYVSVCEVNQTLAD
ncbi:hypothetical protein PSTT_09041 [Puccinia striiformis]|uniref:SMP-30/Gluconolactonase/LRE-like region domain-containing protein n=1 Tax=Puccinia striiformis TaxID=27350 RepID=A0A2S4VA58_9BASI|nr:hypothetical protein PSTT_09041 [Puccinia striiformis]